MHAREWISPATVTYIMHKLLNDPSSKPLIEMFDWYIVPVVNVDGYECELKIIHFFFESALFPMKINFW